MTQNLQKLHILQYKNSCFLWFFFFDRFSLRDFDNFNDHNDVMIIFMMMEY